MKTITHGLAEIKTLLARIVKKQQSIMPYLARPDDKKDPLEAEGGSAKFVAEALQSIKDMGERIIKIRTAIQRANLTHTITVNGEARQVAEWLAWKRDVKPLEEAVMAALKAGVANTRRPFVPGQKLEAINIATAIKEVELAQMDDHLTTTIGELDGALSLHNATAQIDI